MSIKLKRVYQTLDNDDGQRILVDKLWPRGISKQQLNAQWLDWLAPSDELRNAFHHQEIDWQTFRNRYLHELGEQREDIRPLAESTKQEKTTLLYASKDTEHNNAVVLKQYLEMLIR